MSDAFDGLSNIYSLTAKINALKNGQTNLTSTATGNTSSVDPKSYIYEMEKSFSQMLDNLMFSSDEDEKKNNADPFATLIESEQTKLNQLLNNNPNVNLSKYPELNL